MTALTQPSIALMKVGDIKKAFKNVNWDGLKKFICIENTKPYDQLTDNNTFFLKSEIANLISKIDMRFAETIVPTLLIEKRWVVEIKDVVPPAFIKTILGRYYRVVETDQFIYYANYQESDENGQVMMFDKNMQLISDNYFAYADLHEVLLSGKYTYISRQMKKIATQLVAEFAE